MKNAKEAAQIFGSGTRDVFIDTARSEDQKYAAKLTPADSHFLGGSSIVLRAYWSWPSAMLSSPTCDD